MEAAGRLGAGLPVVLRGALPTPNTVLKIRVVDAPLQLWTAPPNPAFDAAWASLRAVVEPVAPAAFACLEGPAHDIDLKMAEQRFGAPLPLDYRSLLSLHNGQRSAGPLPWELAPLHERVMTWAWLTRSGHPPDWWHPSWFPVLSKGSGDYLVLDTTQSPAPVRLYRHDAPERPLLAPSLGAWLLQVQVQLRSGALVGTQVGGAFAGLVPSLSAERWEEAILFTPPS